MKKILVHVGYSISSIGGNVLCKQLRYIKEKYSHTHDIVLVLSGVKTERNKDLIEELSGITFSKVVLTYDKWKLVFPKGIYKYKSWPDFYRNENWFEDIENVDKIYMFGGLINSQMIRKKDGLNNALLKNRFMKFASASCFISTALQLLKLSNEKSIELNEVIYDPQETSLDMIKDRELKPFFHKLWFCYDIPSIGANKLNYLKYFCQEEDSKKELLFSFGSTFVSPHRYHFYDRIKPILDYFSNFSSSIHIYHNRENIDTRVNHSEYENIIAKSYFTMVIPSYDIETFSMIRFYEAIMRNCLPLIHKEVNCRDVIESYNLDENVIEQLRISDEHIPVIPEKKRKEILEYLKKKINE